MHQVIQLNDVVQRKGAENVPRRAIKITAPPHLIALSCDHTMLAVNYSLNNTSLIDIYLVSSFLSNVSIFLFFFAAINIALTLMTSLNFNSILERCLFVRKNSYITGAECRRKTNSLESGHFKYNGCMFK